VRDSYRVRQVGHQLQETEVRTIWLFETTPGVNSSKFPVLQHRMRAAGKKQPSGANLSHEGSRFLFPFLVLSCGKKKNRSKNLSHLCLLLGASRGCLGVSSLGMGTPPVRRAEQGLYPHSRLGQLLGFSPTNSLTLADEPEHQRPGLCTQHSRSSQGCWRLQPQGTRRLQPQATLPWFPSPSRTVSTSQGRGSHG